MKKTFTSFILSVMVSVVSMAQQFNEFSTTPADGAKVESVREFAVTFTNLTSWPNRDYSLAPSLTCGDKSYDFISSGIEGNRFYFLLGDDITEPGEYAFVLPAGYASVGEEKSPEVRIAVTIGAATQPSLPEDFTQGIVMLNEDWFGHAPGSMNYLGYDGNTHYNVYKAKNPGHSLGNTSQYGDAFGKYLYIVSKQDYVSDDRRGGRLVRMDATTLEFLDEVYTLPGGDGRAFCAASDKKGYIGTSAGLYAVDLSTMQVDSRQLVPVPDGTRPGQTGEMVRYGNRVFAAQQNLGVVVVDINTDEAQLVEMPKVVAPVVTADGSLYWATTDNVAEFVRMNPETLDTALIDIEGNHAIANSWGTWRKATLAADTRNNVVYYAPNAGWTSRVVAAYNFDTQEFIPDFVSVPGTADGAEYDGVFYSEGLSVDPSTGYLVLSAKKNGWGMDSQYNKVYFYDPSARTFLADKTVTLDEYCWFPAMMIYPRFEAPSMELAPIDLTEGEPAVVDMAASVTLPVGNKHLVRYAVEVADEGMLQASVNNKGELTLKAIASGTTEMTVTADYRGKTVTCTVAVNVSASTGIDNGPGQQPAKADVFTLSGVRVLHAATPGQVRVLPRGVYLYGGKKVVID